MSLFEAIASEYHEDRPSHFYVKDMLTKRPFMPDPCASK